MVKSIHSSYSPTFTVKHVEQRVILNFVSIERNSNKYYIIEFQEGTGSYSFRIYTEYGRMGRSPRQEGRYFHTRNEAKKEFDSLLASKQAKRYELVFIEEGWDDFTSKTASKTPFQNKSLSGDYSPSLSLHTEFGQLSEIQLHKGFQILKEIEKDLEHGYDDFIRLSNKFYSVIPMVFGNKIDSTKWLLNTPEKLNEKKEWLSIMLTSLDNPSNY